MFFLENVASSFPQSLTITEILIAKVTKAYQNNYILSCSIEKGKVQVGDILRFNNCLYIIANVYRFNQPVFMVIAGENCELVINDIPKSTCINELIKSTEGNKALIAESFSYHELSPYITSKVIKEHLSLDEIPNLLTENDFIKQIQNGGIKVLSKGIKYISVAAALSIFINYVYTKFNKTCLLKQGMEKLKCQQQVAQNVIKELTKQQSQCATLTEPKQKQKCLQAVEKQKRIWIDKETSLATIIAQKTQG